MKDLLRNIYFVINFRRMVGAEKHFSSLPRYVYANSQTKIEKKPCETTSRNILFQNCKKSKHLIFYIIFNPMSYLSKS